MSSPSDTDRGRALAVGYVLKSFPRLSETFVLNEVLARETAGERVEIASLRSPTDSRFHGGLGDLRATITWIPDGGRSVERLWTTLRAGHGLLPGFEAALPDLLAADPDDAVQALTVARWALDHDVDHLHAHFATTATTVARLAGRLAGLPFSFTAHAKDIFHESVDRVALARALRDAHHVVTVSDHNLAHLRDTFPGLSDRLHRVYNGVDPALLRPDAGRPSTDPPTIVAVGRLVEKKGFEHLVDATAILRSRGRTVPVLLGGAGRCEAMLRDRVAALDLDDTVTFLGPLTQARTHDLIRRGTVFVAPFVVAPDGDREGLPTVVVEAMALGTPVVTTPITGVPEAVTDGETGVLVPPADPVALADAIERLLDDPVERTDLTVAARRHVERHFDVAGQAAALGRLRRGSRADRAPRADDRASTGSVAS